MHEALSALFAGDFQHELLDNPEASSQFGQHDIVWPSPLQRVNPGSYEERFLWSSLMVEKVNEILATASLTKEETVQAKLFRDMHVEIVRSKQCPMYLMPINAIGAGGVLFSFLESIEWMRLDTMKDFDVLLSRIRGYSIQCNDFLQAMREGISTGFVASEPMMHNMEAMIDGIISSNFGELDDALVLIGKMNHIRASSVQSDILSGKEAMKVSLLEVKDFLLGEYSTYVRKGNDIGASSLPGGMLCYQICLQYHTTTSLTPEEVHAIGLKEVERIKGRYVNEVLKPLGYAPDQMKAFIQDTHNDERHFCSSSSELLKVYEDLCAEISTLIPLFFNQSPKSPLEIVPKDKGPSAFYLAGTSDGKRPGRFYVNVENLHGKPTYESVALALHEAIPGHHHQLSLAAENENLPPFLRHVEDRRYEVCPCRRQLYTAYAEGWALYCEFLGEEMGLYKTPHDLFGRLSMEMMRATRLVVDTGIHAMKWSIEDAIEYMMETTGMQRHEVSKEIRRYASWPGQSVSYKVGQLEFLRLRELAMRELGTKFNLKDFHDICLNSGPVPLSILQDMVMEYVHVESMK